MRPNGSMATCGVSSIGRTNNSDMIYDLSKPVGQGEDDFVASFEDLRSGVRARDGEFLVGISGNDDQITSNVSYDGNAIDPDRVKEYQHLMETILEVSTPSL